LGTAGGDSFGQGISSAGDINDDGFHDMTIGARFNDDGTPGNNEGAVYVIFGGATLPSQINAGNSDLSVLGKGALDQLGFDAIGIGDVNDDDIPDFAVGARLNNDGPGANDAGAIYLIFGSESLSSTFDLATSEANVTILGKAAADNLGRNLGGGRMFTGP